MAPAAANSLSQDPFHEQPTTSTMTDSDASKMATLPPPSVKRPADTDIEQQKPKKRKLTPSKHECVVCREVNNANQYEQFLTCPKKPCNKTCNFCWTKHIRINVIDNADAPVKYMECNNDLEVEQIRGFLTPRKGNTGGDREQ